MSNPNREFKIRILNDGSIEATEGVKVYRAQLQLDPVRRQTIEVLVDMLRESRLRKPQEFRALGENLYDCLLGNDIGKHLNQAINNREIEFLRVVLDFGEKQQALASWPWEYLYCPLQFGVGGTGYFLATKTRLVLMRVLHLDLDPVPLEVKDLPLRVLFVASSPDAAAENEEKLDEVLFERLLEELTQLKEESAGKIDLLPLTWSRRRHVKPEERERMIVTKRNFRSALLKFNPHVIHFIGHGICNEHGGQLALMAEDGTPHWLDGEAFVNLLEVARDLRLVFLHACESALADPYQAVSSVAMRLAHSNIPAVVAMQYKVEQGIASIFARKFYRALAEANSIDLAVQIGRNEIADQVESLAQNYAFGLPVLYLREPGTLFRLNGAQVADGPPLPKPAAGGASLSDVRGTAGDNAAQVICDRCNNPNPLGQPFCDNCGNSLVVVPRLCAQCKQPLKPKAKFCGNCGAPSENATRTGGLSAAPPASTTPMPASTSEAGGFDDSLRIWGARQWQQPDKS